MPTNPNTGIRGGQSVAQPIEAAAFSKQTSDTSPTSTTAAPGGKPSSALLIASLIFMLFLWSLNYIAGKVALRTIDPISLACFRLQVAAVIMLAMYFARPVRTKPRSKDWLSLAALGFFGVVMNQGLFTVGLNYTTSEHSAVIIAIGPVIILILARAMGQEALTATKIFGMALSFLGVFLLETEQGAPSHSPLLLGDLITLGATAGFAIYTVMGKRLAPVYDAVSMNMLNCVAAALMLLPLTVYQSLHLNWKAVGWIGWVGMLYMAIGSSVGAYTIFYWALRYMSASRVAVISYFQPVVVIVLAVLFLGDHPSKYLLVGTALVLAGVVLAERGNA
jgi:drug/metabolite transporter (DMT)-like permease